VAEAAPLIRQRVLDGAPYLGFSAGAAIAADRALIGGCRIDGVEVCDPDAGEELDEVAVADGLGLVPFTVDVHAAQWGTLARLTAAVAAGLVGAGVAIDEHTAVTVRAGDPLGETRATGTGAMWHAVAVAGEPPTVAITRIAGTADTA
jgi:cyanophycinase